MRQLTADTVIRVRREKPALTRNTRIKLSNIVDLPIWHKICKFVEDAKKKPGHKPAGSPNGSGGQFAREYNDSYEEVKTGLEKRYKETEKKLNPEEKQAIIEYTENSDNFNNYARGIMTNPTKRAATKRKIDALDSALNKSEVGENIVVYRTLSIKENEINKIIPLNGIDISNMEDFNTTMKNIIETQKILSPQEGYISTTIKPTYKMAKKRKNKPYVSYKIKVPHEAKGLYVNELSKFPHQEELLILRGYTLDLKEIKYDANQNRFDIEAEIILEGNENDKQ